MHVHIISLRERIVLTRGNGTATGKYQQLGPKGWETVTQKSFDADKKVNIIEEVMGFPEGWTLMPFLRESNTPEAPQELTVDGEMSQSKRTEMP